MVFSELIVISLRKMLKLLTGNTMSVAVDIRNVININYKVCNTIMSVLFKMRNRIQ